MGWFGNGMRYLGEKLRNTVVHKAIAHVVKWAISYYRES